MSTRSALLAAAATEIHRHGYRAARIDVILDVVGVTKGALYHHFGSKRELGYAVVDELLAARVAALITGLEDAADPIAGIQAVTAAAAESDELELGCPIGNLALETAPHDEGFRRRLAELLQRWLGGLEAAIADAQAAGRARPDLDPATAAAFALAAHQGAVTLSKVLRDPGPLRRAAHQIGTYLSAHPAA